MAYFQLGRGSFETEPFVLQGFPGRQTALWIIDEEASEEIRFGFG